MDICTYMHKMCLVGEIPVIHSLRRVHIHVRTYVIPRLWLHRQIAHMPLTFHQTIMHTYSELADVTNTHIGM